MSRAFELKPLAAAAGIGAALFWLLKIGSWINGALVGAAVQVGVRLVGVS